REAHDPRPALADPRRHLHLMGVAWPVLGNRCGRPLVVIQRVLRDPPQDLLHAAGVAAKLALVEKPGKELGIAPAVSEMREAEVAPRADAAVAVAVIDHLDRRAVRIGEVLSK